jgi:hypothetical protein
MADKGGLTYLPGATEANVAYEDALKRLTESLDARKNRLFDPTLLAMAEGFLGPTQTGGFGEALGRAAGKVRGAVAEEEKAEQDIAKAQLALAERGIGLAQQRQREQQFQEYLSGRGAPSGGVPVGSSAPSGVSPGGVPSPQAGEARLQAAVSDKPPPGMEMSVGVQVFPPTQNIMTSTSLLMQRYREGKMSLGDALAEAAKLENDRYVYRDNAVLDKLTGKMYFSPTGDTVEVSTSRGPQKVPKDLVRLGNPQAIEQYVSKLPSSAELAGGEAGAKALAELAVSTETVSRYIQVIGGSADLPKQVAARYDAAAQRFGANSPQAKDAISAYLGLTPGASPGMPDFKPGVPTKEERQRDEQAKNLSAEDKAKYENEQRRKVFDAADSATSDMSRAAVLRQFADDPAAADMFGILSNSDVSSAIARLVEQGLGVTTPGGRVAVGIPEIQTILRNLRLKPEEQAKYQTAIGLMVEAQIKMAQFTKGAVSNYEQQLFARAGINPEDVPGSIRMKADMITLRGQFDKDLARLYEDKNMPIREFKRTQEYQQLREQYERNLSKIAEGQRIRVGGRKRFNPATGQVE